MGIPVGKLALYTVAAGIHPSLCLPISLDVGTNNEALLRDPLYLGWREPRLRGEAYWTLVEEFVTAVQEVFPETLLQWEDFANLNSFRLVDAYREVLPSFNDDIEGTAAMVAGGLLAALRRIGGRLADQVYAIYGGGSAGTGIYRQLVAEMTREGLPAADAGARIFVIDQQGLLVADDKGLDDRMRGLATKRDVVKAWGLRGDRIGLEQVVEHARPSVLIGVCARPNQFTEPVVRKMAEYAPTPIIMPLSNPSANSEAVPSDLIAWTDGRALVATGSPFGDVMHDGRRHRIGQANNVFIFPGMGLGVLVSKARQVTPNMFSAAARTLANCVDEDMLSQGALFPPITDVREVSRRVAHAVAEQAVADGVANRVIDVEAVISRVRWYPAYLPYRPS
jgi:malic enzyme